MEPRFFERGIVFDEIWWIKLRSASMEPRFFERGIEAEGNLSKTQG